MVIGGLHIVFGGSGDLNELGVIFHRILCDKRHISGICVLVGVIKTVGIYKVSACAAYLLGLFVHHVNKVRDALTANMICKDTCGFTGGFQQQRIHKVGNGDLLATLDANAGSALSVKLIKNHQRSLINSIVKILHIIQHDKGCHYLCEGSGIHLLVGIFLINSNVFIEIYHDRSFTGNGEVGRKRDCFRLCGKSGGYHGKNHCSGNKAPKYSAAEPRHFYINPFRTNLPIHIYIIPNIFVKWKSFLIF